MRQKHTTPITLPLLLITLHALLSPCNGTMHVKKHAANMDALQTDEGVAQCAFNPLCTCIRGVVRCRGLGKMPEGLPADTLLLDLRHNRITSLPSDSLRHVPYLHTMLLGDNMIENIEPGALSHLSRLRNLYLEGNRLQVLRRDALFGLRGLRTLSLASPRSNNQLSHIASGAFSRVPKLHVLSMYGNRLRDLPDDMFDSLERLQRVRLDGNAFECDCMLKVAALWLRRHDALQSKSTLARCMHPDKLRGAPITEIAAEHFVCSAESDSVRRGREIRATRPDFVVRPRDTGVREGNRLQLFCRAEGRPSPDIAWFRKGRRVQWAPRIQLDHNDTVLTFMQISDDGTVLRVHNVAAADAGHYWCQANNDVGSMSADVHLRILDGTEDHESTPAAAHPNLSPKALPPTNRHTRTNHRTRIHPHTIISAKHIKIEPSTRTHRYPTHIGHPTGTVPDNAPCRAPRPLPDCTRVRDCSQVRGPITPPPFGIEPPHPYINDQIRDIIVNRVREATRNVDRAINATRKQLHDDSPKSPGEILALFRFPGPRAIELARAREIYEEAVILIERELMKGLMVNGTSNGDIHYESTLSVSHLQMIMELTGCTPGQFIDPCTDMCFHTKYRSYDGQCNNLDKPMRGVSLMPFTRLLPPIYENGFSTPVGWEPNKLYHGFPKPNAREVSLKLVSTKKAEPDPDYTAMLMQWGQFVDHDLDLAAAAPARQTFTSGAICNRTCANLAPCFNIHMPRDDPRYERAMMHYSKQSPMNGASASSGPCIEFERSSAVCGSGETSPIFRRVTQREQINVITSYMDGSQIYGSTEQAALDLRDLFNDHGLLRFDIVSRAQKPYLPFNRDTPMDCRRRRNVTHPIQCFMAGDLRANEQLGLTSMHTIWLREHNRIAARMLVMNPHWDGERIYHETRKIIGAMLQHITYKSWLPKVLGLFWDIFPTNPAKRLVAAIPGPKGMDLLDTYMGYDTSTDASVANAFATAAFRFGHTLINPMLLRLDGDMKPIKEGALPLHEAFFAPERLLAEGGIDPLLRGLLYAPTKHNTLKAGLVSDELTERLFTKAHEVALDLAALNIQRGRDHALPGYMEYYNWCVDKYGPHSGLYTVDMSVSGERVRDPTNAEWDRFGDLVGDRQFVHGRVKPLYGSVWNLDLWLAGILEKPLEGARIGPTFACIIADQFRRTRDGDRFWYENPGVFNTAQLTELRKSTLGAVLCDNGDNITSVPQDVFMHEPNMANFATCDKLSRPNLNLWQECCDQSCKMSGGHKQMSYMMHAEGTGSEQSGDLLSRISELERQLQKLTEANNQGPILSRPKRHSDGQEEKWRPCSAEESLAPDVGGLRHEGLDPSCYKCACKGLGLPPEA